MSPRQIVVVVLGFVLSAAVTVFAPAAQADEDPNDRGACGPASTSYFKMRVVTSDEYRLSVSFAVFSDDLDLWEWRLSHNGDSSARGEAQARDADRSFRVVRRVLDVPGTDDVGFRAENTQTGEVCRGEASI